MSRRERCFKFGAVVGRVVALITVMLCCATAKAASVPTPEAHLGRPVGSDFHLADWSQISSYMQTLAAASPNVAYVVAGKTTSGRDFPIVVVSSPENLARLDEIRADARRIADPRGLDDAERQTLIERARLVTIISNNMHSTEVGSGEMSLQLAYTLATSNEEPWASIRRELVVVILPSTNPDGLERVVQWYRQIQGTAYESAYLPELYQLYAGHDNNRDWFMLSLAETRVVTQLLYQQWFPQVYWDVHQQGQSRERLFFPPFRDPLNPNLQASVIAGINALGSRVMLDLTRWGFRGVSSGVTYDMWWNGGNRNVPVRHNIMGFLSEAASANLASPIFLSPHDVHSPHGLSEGNVPSNRMPAPWEGGWWRVGDIVRYELAVAQSLLGALARERRHWLGLSLGASEQAIAKAQTHGPVAWLIPPGGGDPSATARLLDSLLLSGIEMSRAEAEFAADGQVYPKGTIVLRHAQPYGGHLKDAFEIQRYPDGLDPYDVTGWTLPLLLGVERREIQNAFEVASTAVTTVDDAMTSWGEREVERYPWPHLDPDDSASITGVFRLLGDGVPVFYDGDHESPRPGAWVVPGRSGGKARRSLDDLGERLIDGKRLGSARQGKLRAPRRAGDMVAIDELPRIGVYAPWAASMDEGWLRWVLEHHEVPYTQLRNEHVRAADLGERFDVIILPSVSRDVLERGRSEGSVFRRFTGGLEPEGTLALVQFVRDGGSLIAFGEAGDYVNALFELGLQDAAQPSDEASGESFSCPGSIVRAVPAGGSPWTAGLPASQPLMFSRSSAWRVPTVDEPKSSPAGAAAPVVSRSEALLTFPRDHLLLSGWVRKPEQIADAAAWVRADYGRGQVHVFGFSPVYRSWAQTTFRLLFRAVLLPPPSRDAAVSEPTESPKE